MPNRSFRSVDAVGAVGDAEPSREQAGGQEDLERCRPGVHGDQPVAVRREMDDRRAVDVRQRQLGPIRLSDEFGIPVGRELQGTTPLDRGEVAGWLKNAGPAGNLLVVTTTSRHQEPDDGPAETILPQPRLPGQRTGRARQHQGVQPEGKAL